MYVIGARENFTLLQVMKMNCNKKMEVVILDVVVGYTSAIVDGRYVDDVEVLVSGSITFRVVN
jgi:hypothetical protein